MKRTCHIITALLSCMFCTISAMAQNACSENYDVLADSLVSASTRRLVNTMPSSNNDDIISKYNTFRWRSASSNGADAYAYTALFGVKSNSHMSNDDVEVRIVKRWMINPIYNDMEERVYFIEITNKSDKTIYIDKEHSYRIDKFEGKVPYFDPKKNADDAEDKVLAIEPHSMKRLSDYRYVIRQGGYAEFLEMPEDLSWPHRALGIKPGYMRKGEVRRYSEEDTPYCKSFRIVYSRNKDFSIYSLLTINCYIRELAAIFYPEVYEKKQTSSNALTVNEYMLTNCIEFYSTDYIRSPYTKFINDKDFMPHKW